MNALALFYFYGGGAGVNAPWLEVASGDRSETQNGAFANFDAGCDAGAGADPRAGTDFHRIGEER